MAAPDRGSFIWYELLTTDIAAAGAFYADVVGWTVDADGMPLPGDGQYLMIRRGDGGFAGGAMELGEQMLAGGARPGWLGYIHHPDVDGAAQTIVDAGGAIHSPPFDMEGVGRMAMVADGQGAMFYLMNPIPPADNPDATSDVFDYAKAQHIRWNELQSTDADASVALYTGLFGWRQDGAMPMGELGEYRFFHHGDGMIGAVMPKMPDTPASGWTYYAGVDDIDRAGQAVKDGGGQWLSEIMPIPGGEFALNILDPQGAQLGLVGPRRGHDA